MQVEAEGDVATAFTLARILSNVPLSRGGPTSVVIFDIHALQVCAGCLQMALTLAVIHGVAATLFWSSLPASWASSSVQAFTLGLAVTLMSWLRCSRLLGVGQ